MLQQLVNEAVGLSANFARYVDQCTSDKLGKNYWLIHVQVLVAFIL